MICVYAVRARAQATVTADLHPGNVIMTADGPRIIDWSCALRASGVFDIARVHVSLSELVPEDADPEPPRAINAASDAEA
jgi:Ser/Thr protein kinase RdoA (MazF antagonist)